MNRIMKKNAFTILVVTVMALQLLNSCGIKNEHRSLNLHPLFSDHMVVQQNDTAKLWGTGTPMAKIVISASWGSETVSRADTSGYWMAPLPTPAAGGPYEIRVETRDTEIVVRDVLVGEVWLASGQSNMEMPLKGWPPTAPVANSAEEIAAANFPQIRMFTVRRHYALMPETSVTGEWKISSPETAGDFSATAYFFARKLHNELKVPVGIIHSSWGGTPVEAWTSREKLAEMHEFTKNLEALSPENMRAYEQWLEQFPKVSIPSDPAVLDTLDLQDAEYAQPDFDDSGWESITLPGLVEEKEQAAVDGAFWFRRKFVVTHPEKAYRFIVSNGIDDMDMTWVNGTLIGKMQCWNCTRSYPIPPGLLHQGENTIAVRMIDTGGGGGFSGSISLQSGNGEKISLEGDWRYRHIAEIYGENLVLLHKPQGQVKAKPKGLLPAKINQNTPTVLFNGMIQPLIPYTLRGAIWYQGESNVGRAAQYLKVFPGMIVDWRTRWNRDFPFYFVQIAPYDYGTNLSPALRDAQRLSLKTPGTGMVVTLDIGDNRNIHPANKQDVGKRLALLALANDYGRDVVYSGPLFDHVEVSGDEATLFFTHTAGGLKAAPGGLAGFEIAGKDGKFVPANARISGDQVIVTSVKVPEPVWVRYAWSDTAAATLFNDAGLPASSFSTEPLPE